MHCLQIINSIVMKVVLFPNMISSSNLNDQSVTDNNVGLSVTMYSPLKEILKLASDCTNKREFLVSPSFCSNKHILDHASSVFLTFLHPVFPCLCSRTGKCHLGAGNDTWT